MSFTDKWRHRFRALWRSEDTRREREAEVEFHLSLGEMHGAHAGLARDEARAQARREFGNRAALMEDARGVSRSRWIDSTMQDLRYAFRTLRRTPAYAIGAAATLAIGIGATTAVFSIFDSLVVHGLPYADSSRVYSAIERNVNGGQRTPSYPTFNDWMADSSAWNGAIQGIAFVRGQGVWVDGRDGAERPIIGYVTPEFFPVLSARPHLGRTFLPSEQAAAGDRVVVLSFDAWNRYYGGDPAIIGRTVDIDSQPTRVIGVMPHGFTFPQWASGRAASTAMWMPIAYAEGKDVTLTKRGDHADSRVVLRLRAGADSAQAATALAAMDARLATAYPAESKDWTHADLFPEIDGALGNVRQLVGILGGAVLLVLLLACVNVANLSFVRGMVRSREFAVRAALGGGRGRLIRQLLTESAVIGAASAAAGVLIASVIVGATRTLAADQLPGAQDLRVNGAMLAFAIVVSVVAAMVSALAPALRATNVTPVSAARGSVQSATSSRHDARIRSGLVVVQLAVAVVLIAGTGLLVQSFRHVTGGPTAFDPRGVIETNVTPPPRYADAKDALALYDALIERVRSIPGVTDAAVTNQGRMSTPVSAEGGELRTDIGSTIAPHYNTVSEGYLRTMKMQMAAGRWLTPDDMRTRDHFVVNEALARQLFPNQNPIGRRVSARRAARARPDFGQPIAGTIVGVVRDNVASDGNGQPVLNVYVPHTLETWPWATLFVRTTNVARTIPLVRNAIRDVDPAIPEARASAGFSGVGPMSERITAGFAQRRLILGAIAAFALSALLLAAIGLYSVMSYAVSQRTREVGVRIALGASRGMIVRLVLGEGARVAAAGVVIGSGFALAATRLIRGMLVGTTTSDPPTYLLTAGVLLLSAGVACYLPARRAAKLSPTDAIR